MNTPILFLIFNRLDCTKVVFETIRSARPTRLYVASDGPRRHIESEMLKVERVRNYVLDNIDWDCEVKTLMRPENLGCKYAVSSAISWFFENEEQGIILEDDCVPNESFFRFCQELLVKYKDDEGISLISGDGRGPESVGITEDYSLCKYPLIWGWASWSRVWKNYSVEMEDWPEYRNSLSHIISNNKATVKFWQTTFERVYNKEIDTWDYQLSFLLLKSRTKCIVPKVNLISNIGFGDDATHTTKGDKDIVNRRRGELIFPLEHRLNPKTELKINKFYDREVFVAKKFIFKLLKRIFNLLSFKWTVIFH